MKILQVITRADTVGGAQKHVIDISKQLMYEGHQVTVVSSDSGIFKDLIEKDNIEFLGIPRLKRNFSILSDIRSLFILFKIVLTKRPDVIALHSVKAGLLGRVITLLYPSTTYFTAHGWSHIRESGRLEKIIYIKLEKYLSILCKKVICVSKADFYFARDVIGININRLCLIENGVHPVSRTPQVKAKSNDVVVFLSVVRFQAPKDFETLLLAFSKIKSRAWVLNILGDGPQLNDVKNQISSLNLVHNVRLLGFKDNIDRYYEESDAVVLISKSEGLPMSLLEGMSCSKLLIASDVGGVSDLIVNKWNGFLVPVGDSEYLASCLLSVVNNPNIIEEYGANSKYYFNSNYSFDKMYSKLILLYGEK